MSRDRMIHTIKVTYASLAVSNRISLLATFVATRMPKKQHFHFFRLKDSTFTKKQYEDA